MKLRVLMSLLRLHVSCLNPWARQTFPAPLKIEQTLSHRQEIVVLVFVLFCDNTLEPRYNTVRYNMNLDITRMRVGPQFLPNLPFSYLLNGRMFTKRVNTVIKTVNYLPSL